MEQKTKQRITGAIILVAVLAIFLPILFHNSRPEPTNPNATTGPTRVEVQLPQTANTNNNTNNNVPNDNNVTDNSNQVSSVSNVNSLNATPQNAAIIPNQNTADTTNSGSAAKNTSNQNSSQPAASNQEPMNVANSALAQTSSPITQTAQQALAISSANSGVQQPATNPQATTNNQIAPQTNSMTAQTSQDNSATMQSEAPAQTNAMQSNNVVNTNNAVNTQQNNNTVNNAAPNNQVSAQPAQPAQPVNSANAASTQNATTKVANNVQTQLNRANEWVIQLASFSDSANASRLAVKLQKLGFPVYSRATRSAKGLKMTQIFVGPEAELHKLKKIQQQINSKLHLAGVIRRAAA